MPTSSKTTKSSRSATGAKRKRSKQDTLEAFFGPDGPLAAELPGYETRTEQIQVAEAVERAMREGKPLLMPTLLDANGAGKRARPPFENLASASPARFPSSSGKVK